MLSKLMDAMFGCRHARYSFPITVRAGSRRHPAAQRTGTYVDQGGRTLLGYERSRVSSAVPQQRFAAFCGQK